MKLVNNFSLNGDSWVVRTVDPNSPMLVDRTGKITVATTDPNDHTVYLSRILQGPFLIKVLLHELGHCAMVSYGLIDYIHNAVYPEKWIEAEEWLCNFLTDYGFKIFSTAYEVVGDEAWKFVIPHLEKLIA